MDVQRRVELGREAHDKGFNCCQSVIAAYIDDIELDMDTAMNVAYGLGGGVGHSGELCGALVGAGIVLSMYYGKASPDAVVKKDTEEKILALIEEFQAQRGVIRCEELKGLVPSEKVVHLAPCSDYIDEVIILLGKYM